MAKILGDDQLNILAEKARETDLWEEDLTNLYDPFADEIRAAPRPCPGCPRCRPDWFLDDNMADLEDPFDEPAVD